MDWVPTVEPFIEDLHLQDFGYDKPRGEELNVPVVLRCQNGSFEILRLESAEDWDKWFQSPLFKDGHLDSTARGPDLAGFHVLLSPRVQPVLVGKKPLPRRHYNLPFSMERWKKITKSFLLHRAILYATSSNKCQSTLLTHSRGGEELELHTAVAASFDRQGSFSLSSTYFSASKLSLGVIYACDWYQVLRVTELLRLSPEVASHPLLLAGVFAELQLNRMQVLVRAVQELGDANRELFKSNPALKPLETWKLSTFLARGVLKAREVEEELRATKAHLKEMSGRVGEQKRRWESWKTVGDGSDLEGETFTATTDRFTCRFTDIDIEIDGLIAQCRVAAEQQKYRGELFMAELSRQQAVQANAEARGSRRQARLSIFLASVATIYLPVTSVATIFAVPAFKFDNQWLEPNFKVFNGSSEDNGPSSSSEPLKPVFSGYGVVYLLVSALMTGITIGAYFWARRSRDEDDDVDAGAQGFVDEDEQWPKADISNAESRSQNLGKSSGRASGASSLSASSQSSHGIGTGARFQTLDVFGTIKSWYHGLRQRNKSKAANSPV